jgi:hypothetical protein
MVSPPSVPADGVTSATVQVILRDTNGLPLPGHQIRLWSKRGSLDVFTSALGVTDANGRFTTHVRSLAAGTAVIMGEDRGTGTTFATSASVTFTAVGGGIQPPLPNDSRIKITRVWSEYRLDGKYPSNAPNVWNNIPRIYPLGVIKLPTRNQIGVTVDWGAGMTPGQVNVMMNDVQIGSVSASAAQTILTVNLLTALPNQGPYTLKIQACSVEGNCSYPEVYKGVAYQIPDALVTLLGEGIPVVGGRETTLTYDVAKREGQLDISLAYPATALTNLLDLVFDDSKLGWKNVQVLATLSLSLGGDEVQISLGKDTTLEEKRLAAEGRIRPQPKAMAGAIYVLKTETSLDLQGYGKFNIQNEGYLEGAKIGANVALNVSFTEKYGVLVILKAADLIAPGAGTTLYNATKWLDKKLQAYAYAYVKPSLMLGGQAEWDLAQARFSQLGVSGGAGLAVGLALDAKPWVQAGGEIGLIGESKLFLIPLGCAEVNTTGYGKLWVNTLIFDKTVEGRAELKVTSSPNNQSCSATVLTSSLPTTSAQVITWTPNETPWRIPGGSYKGVYAQSPKLRRAIVPNDLAPQEVVLLTNVFTYTQPNLAIAGSDRAMMAWVHDVLTRPVGQSLEIAYATWDGSIWSAVDRKIHTWTMPRVWHRLVPVWWQSGSASMTQLCRLIQPSMLRQQRSSRLPAQFMTRAPGHGALRFS